MSGRLPRSRRGQVVPLREGADIALTYFNGENETIPELTIRAKKWASRHYQGYKYAAKPSKALLQRFPNLFNLGVQAHLRLVVAEMPAATTIAEPQGASPRNLRRLERQAMNSEPFPEYVEPLIANDEEIEQLFTLGPRQTPGSGPTDMRVDVSMLHESGLLDSLPEFLGQLARKNFQAEQTELTDVVQTQKRRNYRRHLLTGGRPFKLPGDDEDSGNETDASSSTTASLEANLKKRKAREMTGADDVQSPLPNKVRLNFTWHPPNVLEYYDEETGKFRRRANPDAQPDDPWVAFQKQRAVAKAISRHKTTQTSSSSSDSIIARPAPPTHRRMIPIHTVKIRIPSDWSSESNSSRSSSEDSKVVTLRLPTASRSDSPSAASVSGDQTRPASGSNDSSSSSGVRRIKVLPRGSRTNCSSSDAGREASPAESVESASSRGVKRIKVVTPGTDRSNRSTEVPDLTTGPTSSASSVASDSSGRVTRIRVVNRMGVSKMALPERRKHSLQLVEKVEEYLKTL
ncbi:hypothetical protein QBC43DRAFT_263731 [Cladorrhinum sp. PSN259]|nr:hypothetical protein QBC43DRAFT_263731 [Cladorrhinum sp. PSN259]